MILVVGCRILVKPYKIEEHDEVYARAKASGLLIAERTERLEQTKIDRGTVLAIGEKCQEDYVGTLKVGDVIGYAKFGGKFIEDPEDGETYLVINDEDVVCILKGSKE
jgi:co-chaperonin GroES (HSP10)